MKPYSVRAWILIWIAALLLLPAAVLIPVILTDDRPKAILQLLFILLPLILFSLVIATAWRQDTYLRRCAENEVCPKCGYKRAGLDPTARCPECGKS